MKWMPSLRSEAGTCRFSRLSWSSSLPEVSVPLTGDRPVMAGGGGAPGGTEGVVFSFAMVVRNLLETEKKECARK
jgi:hypothetical protein